MVLWFGFQKNLDNYHEVIKRKTDHQVYLDLHFRNWTRFSIIYSATENFSQCCWETNNSNSPPVLHLVCSEKKKRERNEEEWEKGHWCFLLVLTYLVILKVRQVRRNRRWKPSSNRLHPGTAFERISSPTLDGGSNLCCLPLTHCGGNLIPPCLIL